MGRIDSGKRRPHHRLDGWRLGEGDDLDGREWKLATRRVNLTRGGQNDPRPAPVLPNGVYVTAEIGDAQADFEVNTAQGDFSFRLDQAAFGRTLSFLDGGWSPAK